MTEKRFTINMEYECIDDAKKEIWIDFNDRIDFYELCEFLNKLNDENEQLKAQLMKGEDVCSICKHQYMTKRDTDEYYIAKCKKEHIECSKGTVNYCEDFELRLKCDDENDD